ncbi:MAG: hypothetical protein H7289_05185, partial [Mucilaginibacter sp.]|nr:hypothetical protein [Mucilaginibacter sp.]
MRPILFLFFLLIVSSARSQTTQNWKNGYYYTSSGEKVSGSINYKAYNNAFKFRSTTGEEVSIKITQVKALVIPDEADSVTVLTEGGNESKKYFAKVAGASPTTKFYYKLKAQRKGGVTIHADDNTASLETPERPYFTMKNTNFSEDPKYVAVERV